MKRLNGMSTTGKATAIVALLGVLAAIVFFAASALANGLAAPTITVKPANPTSSQSASFTYTDSSTITKFQCQLDGGGYTDCGTVKTGSSKSYPGPLAPGSHTFQVRAVYNSTTSSATSYTWVIDRTAPTVTSINTAAANPTKASSVTWTVVFSESVTGVATSNFATIASGLTGSTAVTAVSGSGTTYTVTASTGTSGSGTLQLKLSGAGSIKDLAGNALGGTIPFLGQTYTIDRTAPTVVSITLAGPSPTNTSSVTWTVTFSENVTGVAKTNFGLVVTGLGGSPTVTTVSGSGTTYAVTASTGTGNGTLQLKLSSAGSIKDTVGNALGGTIPFLGQTCTIDRTAPTVVSINLADANPTSAASVHWTVTFSESVTGVDATDFTLAVGGGLGGTPAITAVTGSGSSYTVTASTGSGPGTLGLNLVDNDSIKDAAGNKLGGTGTGNGNFTGQVYTITAATGMPFTISGNAVNALYPGGVASPINLVFTNPNSVAITVTSVTVTISSTSGGASCLPANFSIGQQLMVSVTVPATSTKSLSDLGVPTASWPTILMVETGANQNACAAKTVNLSYAGSAHS